MKPERGAPTRFLMAALAVVAVGATVFGLRVAASDDGDDTPANAGAVVDMPTSPGIEEAYGIRVRRVSLIGENGMVELRYQLLDADLAEVIHADDQDYTEDFPRVVAGGHTLVYPTFHHHGGDLVTGREFSILYANADGAVRSGGTVSIEIGGERLDDVPVD